MSARTRNLGFLCLVAVATVGYTVQCFTPLRVNGDALNYLQVAASAAHGKGFTVEGAPDLSPPGYPAIIWLMIKLGLGHSWYLNFLNLLGIAVGLTAANSIARSRGLSRDRFKVVILVCLFSFAFIKHAAIPMTDVPFFGISLAALAAAESATVRTGRDAWILWAFSLLLMATGFSLRVAGIAGLAVVLFECMKAALRSAGRARIPIAVLLGATGIGAAVGLIAWERRPGAIAGTPVMLVLKEYTKKPVTSILGSHLMELGQVVLNVPQSKVPGGTPTTVPAGFLTIYDAAALLVAGSVGLALARSRRNWTPANTFMVCYTLMILFPYLPGQAVEPRMWLPLMPLMTIEMLSPGNRLSFMESTVLRRTGYCYLACFLAMGVAALSYSGLLTLSRTAFLNLEMIQQWRPEYEAWLLHRPAQVGRAPDPQVLSILREFGGNR